MKQIRLSYVLIALLVLALPVLLQTGGVLQGLFPSIAGDFWVRILASAILYIMLAVGLNMIVGYAGLLDLGYVAFYAMGAYLFALLASPHLIETFPAIKASFPNGLHLPWWLVLPLAAALAGFLGILLGTPVLKLRGDYLAIVTLGFGEIIRVLMNNLETPINITNGPKGINGIDPIVIFGISLGENLTLGSWVINSVSLYYYFFLIIVCIMVMMSHRIQLSRIGRAWMAIREDQIAAQAMGINTRNMKLLAFAMGASFGGVSGVLFASFQRGISPEAFSLMESIMIVAMVVLGGMGHLPGVILGALFLATLPEVLRFVAGTWDLRNLTDGRIDGAILRQLLVAIATILIVMLRPQGLWPAPEHGKKLKSIDAPSNRGGAA